MRSKSVGIFSLAMITIGSVDSIRNLPATALFGSTLIFFFILAALFFLLPSALVAAELASTSQSHEGIYAWVKEAFGWQYGFLAIWLQWIENVIWYPTILSFVAATLGYLISPSLATNKIFLMSVILTSFWAMTLLNFLGFQTSAWFSNVCALSGLLLPMILIIGLGAVWIFQGHPSQIAFHPHELFPLNNNMNLWISLTGIMLSCCGMEIATVHAQDVKNPERTFPRAIVLSTFIILFTLICGSLAIAIVLPSAKISLVAGIMQAFNAFFSVYHLHWLLFFVALMLVMGGMGSVNNWIIAPTRGLLFALKETNLHPIWYRTNRFGAPVTLLLSQLIIVTLITLFFLFLPSINGSYWFLTVLAAQLYMLMYILMFASAIRLRYRSASTRAGFRIGGAKNIGMWIVAGFGILGSLTTFIIGFIPPSNIQIGVTWHYELLLVTGLIVMMLPPFMLAWRLTEKPLPHAATGESP